MESEAVLMILGLGIVVIGFAILAASLWRAGSRSLPLALLLATGLMAAMCYVIGAGTPGFLGGLGWILASMALLAGPGAGLLLGIIIGAVREAISPSAPLPPPSDETPL